MLENRKDIFPVLDFYEKENVIYFDAACTYLKNIYSFEGEKQYYFKYSCCSGDRGFSILQSDLSEIIDNLRIKILNFIGASSDDYIIFTSSATDSINKLIYSLDEDIITDIIVSDLEHNSNILPQIEYSKMKNIKVHILPYNYFIEEIDKLESFIKEKLTNKNKFLLSFTHSSNVIGGTFNVKNISRLIHEYGGYLLVDDSQFITYNKEDVNGNGIDFMVFSAHKLGGPTGLGFLYIKKDVSNIIKYSNKIGGGTVLSFKSINNIEYKNLPYFLEGGVQHFSALLGFYKLLDFFDKVGVENINNYVLSLTNYFWDNFNKYNELNKFLQIVSFRNSSLVTLNGINRFDCRSFLQYINYFSEYKFIFRVGSFCGDLFINKYIGSNNLMRLSFGVYNTKEEIDLFFDVLLDYIKKL